MYDHKHCDAEYAAQLVKEVKEKYAPLLEAAQGKPAELELSCRFCGAAYTFTARDLGLSCES